MRKAKEGDIVYVRIVANVSIVGKLKKIHDDGKTIDLTETAEVALQPVPMGSSIGIAPVPLLPTGDFIDIDNLLPIYFEKVNKNTILLEAYVEMKAKRAGLSLVHEVPPGSA